MRTAKNFFCLEGIDGSGKTTQLEMLARALKARGHSIVRLREPGGAKISEEVRKILLDASFKGIMGNKTELLLYNAARAQVIEEIISPALKEGKIVLADRFAWSTLAYQGYGRNMPLKQVEALSEITCDTFFPDLTIVLDIDAHSARARVSVRGGNPDRLEREEDAFFERVRMGYRQIAKDNPECVSLFDGKEDKETLHEKILIQILERLS